MYLFNILVNDSEDLLGVLIHPKHLQWVRGTETLLEDLVELLR